jgi:predicted metal-dependent peptidase
MVDYSYRKPSRRAEAVPGVIFPILQQPIPDVAVVCDTSGSMTAGQFGRALVEIESLLQRAGLRDKQVRVLVCDVDVKSVRRVSRASQVELVGGGGTDMAAGIARALALRPRPSVVVVLTDGWTPWPAQPVRGARVIVALIKPTGGNAHRLIDREPPPPPSWARTVRVEVPA